MILWIDAQLPPQLAPPSIVWLTCGNTSNAALRALLSSTWPRIAALLAAGEPLVELSDRAS